MWSLKTLAVNIDSIWENAFDLCQVKEKLGNNTAHNLMLKLNTYMYALNQMLCFLISVG